MTGGSDWTVVDRCWGHHAVDLNAQTLASTGPPFEAIEPVGIEAFVEAATVQAARPVRDGLPLRAAIADVAYLGNEPGPSVGEQP